MRPTKNTCADCGEYPVNHAVEWTSALTDSVMTPLMAPIDAMIERLSALAGYIPLDRLALPLYRLLAMLDLGDLRTTVSDTDIIRAKLLWRAAEERGITLYQFQVLGRPDGTNLFVAMHGGNVRAFEGLPRPGHMRSRALSWMDNKGTMKNKFLRAGIPVARGRSCLTYAQAIKTFREIGGTVITKPNLGSRSRHTTVHIRDEEMLKKAFRLAKKLSPWVVVEEELQGHLFRILLINGKVAGVLRREPAHVVGDGKSTIRTLVEKENKNPRRQGPTFHALPMDADAEEELSRQNYTWESVPEKDSFVTLNPHISRFFGGSTTDFIDRVHPDNVALFEHIAKTLDDTLIGVDFIIGDMSRSWRDQKLCGVIECNSLPNIELHNDVLYGDRLDAAGLLLDLVFPDAKRTASDQPRHARAFTGELH